MAIPTRDYLGKTTVPATDYDSVHINTNAPVFIGVDEQTSLHVLTFNQAGSNWAIDVWEFTSLSTDATPTSAGKAFINPAVQGTFGYNIASKFGFLINPKAGTPGDLTVAFRVDA